MHQINTIDIHNWMDEKEVEYAGHFGNGHHKKLIVTLRGEWVVRDHHKDIYRGNLIQAVEVYNAIMPTHTIFNITHK